MLRNCAPVYIGRRCKNSLIHALCVKLRLGEVTCSPTCLLDMPCMITHPARLVYHRFVTRHLPLRWASGGASLPWPWAVVEVCHSSRQQSYNRLTTQIQSAVRSSTTAHAAALIDAWHGCDGVPLRLCGRLEGSGRVLAVVALACRALCLAAMYAGLHMCEYPPRVKPICSHGHIRTCSRQQLN